MKRLLSLAFITACTATVTSTPPPAQPSQPPPPAASGQGGVAVTPMPPPPHPEKHPSYMRALADLRQSRGYLEIPAGAVVKWDQKRAVNELDAAIAEIKQASIDDGKSANDHGPVDAGMLWGSRLQKSRELAEAARKDINQEEDNGWANGLKNRALGHIDNAVRAIDDGIADAAATHPVAPPPPAEGPQAHPAYLHALSDLRMARALLERPTRADVKWDETNAIHEVDAAINEIKQAAIDDGKPLADHPPVDAKLNHHDRLKEAMELLRKAAKDIEEREDNTFAKGLRGRAVGHIRNAEHGVHEAVEDRKEDKKEEKREEKKEEKAGKGHGAMEKNH